MHQRGLFSLLPSFTVLCFIRRRHTARIINCDHLNPIASFPLSSPLSRWQPASLPSLSPLYIYIYVYISVINPFIFYLVSSLNRLSLCTSACLSVSALAGHTVYQRSARWQRLRPDGWHLQPMVSSRRLGGREEECLREEHVCVVFFSSNIQVVCVCITNMDVWPSICIHQASLTTVVLLCA